MASFKISRTAECKRSNREVTETKLEGTEKTCPTGDFSRSFGTSGRCGTSLSSSFEQKESSMRVFGILSLGAFAVALALWPALAEPATASPAGKGLQVYFVDVEGGQSTLFVTPSGQSLLIDTGWAGNDGRDANRIVAAAKKAGVTRINYVLITHFHGDHVGGAPELAARIPIDTFIDHGENPQVNTFGFQIPKEYQQLIDSGKYKHVIAKPGDTVPIQGMQVTVVSGNAATISHSLPGAGQKNPSCDGAPQYPRDTTENRNSLGAAITFGKLRILDLGDLTTDEEMELMCPVNKLGRFDILVVSHHGSTSSSSPQLVYGIAARVAIMDNGATKGGSPSVWDTIEKSPGLEDSVATAFRSRRRKRA